MGSLHARFVITILIVGLISACGIRSTRVPAPAPQPTDTIAAPAQALPTAPASPMDPVQPTTAPATESAVQGSPVSFANDVLPLLESRCKNCHGGNRTEEGLILLSYQDLMNGSTNGLIVTPGDANHSLLAELLVEQKMPKRGPKLTPEQTQLIIDWINQGALNN